MIYTRLYTHVWVASRVFDGYSLCSREIAHFWSSFVFANDVTQKKSGFRNRWLKWTVHCTRKDSLLCFALPFALSRCILYPRILFSSKPWKSSLPTLPFHTTINLLAWSVFALPDSPFTLSIDFINTAINGENVTGVWSPRHLRVAKARFSDVIRLNW